MKNLYNFHVKAMQGARNGATYRRSFSATSLFACPTPDTAALTSVQITSDGLRRKIRGKVELYLCTPQRRIGAAEIELHSFLTSALRAGERSTSRPGRFTSRKEPRCP